jgi:beta-lactamase class A
MMHGEMLPEFGRRPFMVGALLGAVACTQQRPALATLTALESQVGGRFGVAALDTRTGARVSHRGGERFAMCSTFKWLLAAAALSRIDAEREIPYSSADLLDYSDVTRAHVADGHMSVGALCDAAVEVSDNAAANLLLHTLGDPPVLTAFLRGLGDHVTRLDRFEPELNVNALGDERDTTTPDAMLETMHRALGGDALPASARERVASAMKRCRTGLKRLRAGVPSGWVVADKTGTGERGAVNDVAIVWPPERPPILIASYLSDSNADTEALEAVHARVARAVLREFGWT